MKKVVHHSPFVKPGPNWEPCRLAMVILEKHRFGHPDEIVFLPICSGCGKIISDLKSANIEAAHDEPIPAGDIDGLPISRLPGKVYAFHVPDCVPSQLIGPWKPLGTVLKNDQRYECEK